MPRRLRRKKTRSPDDRSTGATPAYDANWSQRLGDQPCRLPQPEVDTTPQMTTPSVPSHSIGGRNRGFRPRKLQSMEPRRTTSSADREPSSLVGGLRPLDAQGGRTSALVLPDPYPPPRRLPFPFGWALRSALRRPARVAAAPGRSGLFWALAARRSPWWRPLRARGARRFWPALAAVSPFPLNSLRASAARFEPREPRMGVLARLINYSHGSAPPVRPPTDSDRRRWAYALVCRVVNDNFSHTSDRSDYAQ